MDGVEWTPVSFCGNLDGNGYVIKNLSVTEADNGDGEYWSSMFAQLINATVSNLTFRNCSASISAETNSSRDVYVSVLSANTIASKLEDIKVVDSVVTQNGYAKNMGYAAFVTAFADISNITNCIVEGGTVVVNSPATNPMNVGGITGCFEDMFYEYIADYGNPFYMEIGAGSPYGIYNCYVNGDITVTAGASSHVAGIVGMTSTDFLDRVPEQNGVAVEVKNCVYKGNITATNNDAAGITGWDEPEDCIVDCVSLAVLSAPVTFPFGELPETITNSYYLSDEANGQGGRTAEQFENESVCTERGGHFIVDDTCVMCQYYIAPSEYVLSFSELLSGVWLESGTYRIENGEEKALTEQVSVTEGQSITLNLNAKSNYVLQSVACNGTEYPVKDGTVTFTVSESGAVTAKAEEKQKVKPYFETVEDYVFQGTYEGKPSFVTYAKMNPGYGYDDKVSEFGFVMKTVQGQDLPLKTEETIFPAVLQYGIRAFGELNQGETYQMTPYLIVEDETVTGTAIPVTVE